MSATVKVSNVSPKATERDLWEFFAFSGEILSIQLHAVEAAFSQTAYVTFADDKALETALLLTGVVIVDRQVTVEAAVGYEPPPRTQDSVSPGVQEPTSRSVERAEDVVSNLLAKGYILSKDAMTKAKAFDERHQLSKTASEKAAALGSTASYHAAELDRKMGLSQRITAGAATVNESLKMVDEKYKVSDKSKAAFVTAEQKVNEAAAAVMKFKIVANGAAWLSGTFGKVAKVAEDVNLKTKEKVQQQEAGRGEGSAVPGPNTDPPIRAAGQAEPLSNPGPAVLPHQTESSS